MAKTLSFEKDELQQQKTTSGDPLVSQEQKFEAILGIDSPEQNLD